MDIPLGADGGEFHWVSLNKIYCHFLSIRSDKLSCFVPECQERFCQMDFSCSLLDGKMSKRIKHVESENREITVRGSW